MMKRNQAQCKKLVVSCLFFSLFLLSCSRKDDTRDISILEPAEEPLAITGVQLPPIEVRVDPEVILRVIPPDVGAIGPIEEPREQDVKTDEDILLGITHRWVYVAYSNVDGRKVGSFRYNNNLSRKFTVEEGQMHEGISVISLDESKAICAYGNARDRLALIYDREVDPAIIADPSRVLWDPSAEAQEKAYRRYWELYGKPNAYRMRDYVPAPGQRMPPTQEPTKEEARQAVDNYLDYLAQYIEEARNRQSGADNWPNVEQLRGRLLQQLNLDEDTLGNQDQNQPPSPNSIGDNANQE